MARPHNAPRLTLTAWVLAGLTACSSPPIMAALDTPNAVLDGTHIPSARSLLAVARVERSAGNTPLAESLLVDLLRERPQYVGGHVELASMQLEVGNLMRARQALDEGLSVVPDNLELLRLDGTYHLANGNLERAHKSYYRVAEERPQDLHAARNLALILVMQGRDEEAREVLVVHLDAERANAALRALVILRARSAQQPSWKTRAPKLEPEPLHARPVHQPGMLALPLEPVVADAPLELPLETLADVPIELPEDHSIAEPVEQPVEFHAEDPVPAESLEDPRAKDPGPAQPEPPVSFSRQEWRGIPKGRLTRYGPLVVQGGPLVQIQFSAGGQLTVIVDRYAKTGTWVLGPKSDYRLEPGSRVRFQGDGSLFTASGEREMKLAPAGRPAAERVWP